MSDHLLETYKSMFTVGIEATKALVLLNGGAIVAMLAFIGQAQNRGELAGRAGFSIGVFIVGLAIAVLSFLTGYLTQHDLFNEGQGRVAPGSHVKWQWITVGALLVSLLVFSYGSFAALLALG